MAKGWFDSPRLTYLSTSSRIISATDEVAAICVASPQKMKKTIYLLFLLILECSALYPAWANEKDSSWNSAVQEMKNRIITGSLGRDFKISFYNRPYQEYTEEELMIYTLSGNGTAIIQMGNRLKELKISPEELFWFCKSLLDYKLADFAENEARIEGSASYSIIIGTSESKKGICLYKARNDTNREVVWQYMFRFGQLLLERAGLRDKNESILPVCKGIVSRQEIDSDNDGLIDWLRVNVGFYNFRAGDFIIDFSGYTQNIFLSQGNSSKEFFLNTYLLQGENKNLKDFFKMRIDSKKGSSTGLYIMDMGLSSYGYKKKNLRAAADIVFKGSDTRHFKVKLNQTVVLEIKKGESGDDGAFGWFCVSGILPDGTVRLVGKQYSEFVLGREDFPLVFLGCISSYLRLYQTNADNVIFEIIWRVPDKEILERRITHFIETAVSDNYRGDKEAFKASLESDEKCRKDLETQHELEIDISYCIPPVQRI